jgi:hypothetical protein
MRKVATIAVVGLLKTMSVSSTGENAETIFESIMM